MKGNHEIDGFVRRKLAEREFAFEDAFWEEAEKLLDAQQGSQRKPRRGFWLFLFLLTGISVLGVYGLGTWLSKTPTPQIQQQTTASPVLAEQKTTSSQPQEDLQVLETNAKENLALVPPSNTETHSSAQNRTLETSSAVSTSRSIDNVQTNIHKLQTPIFTQLNQSDNSATAANQLSLHALSPNSNTQLAYTISPTPSSTAVSPTLHKYDQFSSIDAISTELQVEWDPEMDIRPIKRKRFRHRLFLEAGSSMSTQAAFAPYLGLMYQYRMGARLQVETGVRYRVQTGLKYNEHVRQEIYSFGYIVDDYTADIDRLHYVEMPLHLRFRLAARHSLSGGLSAGYLVYSEGELLRTRNTSISSESLETTNFNNFLDPFSNMQWQGEVGYTYHLHRRFSIGAQARYRFNDIYPTETDAIGKWQFGLRLRYHLLSK